MSEAVDLPSGITVPVDPYDPDDPEDMEDLMNLIAVIASERVAMDDFDVTTAEQMTVADLTALVQAVLPGGDDE